MRNEKKIRPQVIDLYRLGTWTGRISSINQNSRWGLAKIALQALASEYKNKEGFDFIGDGAEYQIDRFGKDYADDKKPMGSPNSTLLHGVYRKWEGRLEEVFKEWVISHPQSDIDIVKLQMGAKAFLTDKEWDMLEPLEKEGLNEAASCLLFNNFTSAEFIALRSVESLLRKWYEKEMGKPIEDVTWGRVINKLSSEFPENKRPKAISYLYFLKARRDAVAHPEVISSIEDAEMTFLQVIQAVKILLKQWV